MNPRLPVSVLLLCVVLAFPSNAENKGTAVASSGNTVLKELLDSKAVEVEVRTIKVKKSETGFPLTLDYYDEVSVVQQVSITVGGQSLWVPRSAYADLFNARTAFVKAGKGGFVLVVGCADGSDSYSVQLRFDTNRVVSRRIYSATSAPKLSEETRYSAPEVIG